MIANAIVGLGAWAWIILGVVLIGVELIGAGRRSSSGSDLPPSHRVARCGFRSVLADRGACLRGCSPSWRSCLGRFVMPVRDASRRRDAAPLNRRGEALVGRVFTLEAPIERRRGPHPGRRQLLARDGPDRFAGAKVRVVRVEGTTLVVDDP